MPGNREPASKPEGSWLKRNIVSILMFLLVAGVTGILFAFQGVIKSLGNYGHLGAFLLSLATNATIILPMPAIILLLPLGASFNPVFIGLAAGLGGAMGEMTAYIGGYSGRGIWHDNPNYLKAVAWLKKWGMLIVFMFAALPMPMDVMGLASGNLRLPWWRFFLPAWIGKSIKYVAVALAGYFGWEFFITNSDFRTALESVTIAVIATAVVVVLGLLLEYWTWQKKAR